MSSFPCLDYIRESPWKTNPIYDKVCGVVCSEVRYRIGGFLGATVEETIILGVKKSYRRYFIGLL